MPVTISLKSKDGKKYVVQNKILASGAKKNVYAAPDRSYVVAIYKNRPDQNSLDRLQDLTGKYKRDILEGKGGSYYEKLFCWPKDIVESPQKQIGIVMPFYPDNFFFHHGDQQGNEKVGKWFTSAYLRKLIHPVELGNWKKYIELSLRLSRAIRRLHASGLAHSDLSYNNVLIDPSSDTGKVMIIDIDELVVPGKYPSGVLGTRDFIAPEVLQTFNLPAGDHRKRLPCRETDLHALALLIYMYLLYRHPLKGSKVWDASDPDRDDLLSLGEKALFIENSKDRSNIPDIKNSERVKDFLPWIDVQKYPYTLTGPFLSNVFRKAFEDGLHNPGIRPIANEWEDALMLTYDRLIPCGNSQCHQKWFVMNKGGTCPFCGWKIKNMMVPVLQFYKFDERLNDYVDTRKQITIHNERILNHWHISTKVIWDVTIDPTLQKRVGFFRHDIASHKWIFYNEQVQNMKLKRNGTAVPIGKGCRLDDGDELIMGSPPNGYMLKVKMLTF